MYDVLFTNEATKYRHKPHFLAEAPFNEKHNKARTSVDTYHYGIYKERREKLSTGVGNLAIAANPMIFPLNSH